MTEPLRILEVESKFDFKVNVNGGGIKGQAEAIRLGISRIMVKESEGRNIIRIQKVSGEEIEVELNEAKAKLKEGNREIMTRDARKVERKKPGLRKARKASQFSKR